MKFPLIKSFDFPYEPVRLLDLFKNEPCVFFLESSLVDPNRGRYSFLGFDPFRTIQQKGQNPFPALRRAFAHYHEQRPAALPLTSGMVGFLSYDAGFYLEKIPSRSCDDLNLPDCFFGFYDTVFVIDHLRRRLFITSSGLPERTQNRRMRRAQQRLKEMEGKLSIGTQGSPSDLKKKKAPHEPIPWRSNCSAKMYEMMVKKAKDYIRRGDIYQVNLAQRFEWEPPGNHGVIEGVQLYKTLRQSSPACFAGYLNAGNFQIVSSSPERFLRLNGQRVQTRPMKGTRPRGAGPQEDRRMRRELDNSAKERAELLMITDLERNDLGRVCEYGSVKVKTMRSLETYRTVFQTTSTIEGILRKDQDGFDLLQSCFPGGSITGCPKIRAMEIIEELESARRGIYTGTLGYMDFSGNLDFNILIRTFLVKDRKIYFHVGSGIVADSTPATEYQETLVKARGLKDALKYKS